ncbi:hypothetical protein D915_005874 [Fasciola hepatica]|uniref:Receptor L-domain domain-containing protein n=1 Tax=Fasciola hepatica TaxID=6192 RepID=A0A4E0RS39_FASHE|nr:hypothetical protein D915_005874 [Fasciola hepatica]
MNITPRCLVRTINSLAFIYTVLIVDIITTEEEAVCSRQDIRQTNVLERMCRCDVVEGDLSIAFVWLTRNLSFHRLREISGSLLLYDVDGLSSLSTLFPRLTVIRGHSLIYSYALVVRATAFQDIALPSLQLIERGGVRIENNPKLCHSNLVHWTALWNHSRLGDSKHPVDLINNGGPECSTRCPAKCPLLPDGQRGCWSETMCQTASSHPPLFVLLRFRYQYRQRRCVTVEQCLENISLPLIPTTPRISTKLETTNHSVNYSVLVEKEHSNAIYRGACVTQCPVDHVRDKSGHCTPCESQCPRKSCPELLIHDLRDLDALVGCYSAVAIYLSIQDGEPEFVNRLLEEAFSRLRVVEQSLRIVRSPVLTALPMLNNLQSLGTMHGNVSHPIVLEISGNDNLADMWSPRITSENLQGLILRGPGTIRITQNRRLCPNQVFQLFRSDAVRLVRPAAWLSDVERDLIQLTNGDLAYCNWSTILVNISQVDAISVQISWLKENISNTVYEEEEPVLMFLLYRHVPIGVTVTQNPGSSVLNEWKMLPVACATRWSSSLPRCTTVLGNLSPATRYAVYLEIRYPLRRTGALSKVLYFITRPVNPTAPRYTWLEAINASALNLTWIGPSSPGGQIDSYLIWFRSVPWNPRDYAQLDACLQNSDGLISGGPSAISSSTPFLWNEKADTGKKASRCKQCSRCPALHRVERLYKFVYECCVSSRCCDTSF